MMKTVLVGILATWRLAALLVNEDGPFDVLARFRDTIGVKYNQYSGAYAENEFGKLFTCVKCFSVWAGWIVALLLRRKKWFIEGLAYSAGAIFINRWQ